MAEDQTTQVQGDESQAQEPGGEARTQNPGTPQEQEQVGVVFDRNKERSQVYTGELNPDGTPRMVDFTPGNEDQFFIIKGNPASSYYENMMKAHRNPKFDVFMFPRAALKHAKEAFKHYFNGTTEDAMKFLMNYKMEKDGQFTCTVKGRGFREDEIPWNALSPLGYDYGSAVRSGDWENMKHGNLSSLSEVKFKSDVVDFYDKVKFQFRNSQGKVRVKVYAQQRTPQYKLPVQGEMIPERDIKTLIDKGNLGYLHTGKDGQRYFVSYDNATGCIATLNQKYAYIPDKIYGQELSQQEHDVLAAGGAVHKTNLAGRHGEAFDGDVQINAFVSRVMTTATRQQRIALAKEMERQGELQGILQREPEAIGKKPEQPGATQTPSQTPEADKPGKEQKNKDKAQTERPQVKQSGNSKGKGRTNRR